MPKFTILIYPDAGKQLASLPANIQKVIDQKILALGEDPFPAGFKKLKDSEGYYRIRSGDYRIIYRLDGERLIVIVVRVGNRKELYKKALPSPEMVKKSIPGKKDK
jgi:mRNA interferase RelE/StbE